MVGSGRFVISTELDNATKFDGDVDDAGKTLGIKIHSAGVSVFFSEIETKTEKFT